MTPARIAIVGSGPAGFYAAADVFKRDGSATVDMIDRLPTPGGLVRAGVSPDHAARREVIDTYERLAMASGRFRFFGKVEIGKELHHDDLMAHYDAVIYACGSAGDRELGIPGEDLPGSHAATSFVGWYNGHPDYAAEQFDLSGERAVVVGNGNVALDVARMLLAGAASLRATDIAEHALRALRTSQIREVIVIGRRGASQSSFTTPEVLELGQQSFDVLVENAEATPGAGRNDASTYAADLKLRLFDEFTSRAIRFPSRRVILRFLTSPTQIIGDDRVRAVQLVRNRLEMRDGGGLVAVPTDQLEEVSTGLLLRAVGYRGQPVPGLPFDSANGIIPNRHGRVVDESSLHLPGTYVAGWLKRGPSGVIGTNKICSRETVSSMLDDLGRGRARERGSDTSGFKRLLAQRCADHTDYFGWKRIDQYEREVGLQNDRLRRKVTDWTALNDLAHGRSPV